MECSKLATAAKIEHFLHAFVCGITENLENSPVVFLEKRKYTITDTSEQRIMTEKDYYAVE